MRMRSSRIERSGGKILLAVCALAFLTSAGLRLLEARRWDPSRQRVDEEYLLATHDAYAWLAGAERKNLHAAESPMSAMLAGLAGATGLSVANLAYWLPPALAALSAIPIALWAAQLDAAPLASLAAGMLASLAPAYFSRTRLGYFDTDWALLFFPLLISWLLASALQPLLRRKEPELLESASNKSLRRWAILLLLIPLSLPWHGYVRTYVLAVLWLSLGLLAAFGERTSRWQFLVPLTAVTLATGLGWIGSWAGVVLLLLHDRRQMGRLGTVRGRWSALALLLSLLILFTGWQFQDFLLARLSGYLGMAGDGTSGLSFPDFGISIREVQRIGATDALQGAGFAWWLGGLGLIGFLYLLIRFPVVGLLAPLLALGLLSPRIGIRFAMFASPAVVLGLIVPLDRLAPDPVPIPGDRTIALGPIYLGALLLSLAAIQRSYTRLPIETVLTRPHAATLRELETLADPAGVVWTWWDYGYASQYYSGLATFADGGRNTGEYLFTLGTVLGSDRMEASADLIAYAAAHEHRPWRQWAGWGPARTQTWFDHLGVSVAPVRETEAPQYLVIPWEGISFLPWIQYYGSWDFMDEEGRASTVLPVPQPLELDLASGRFLSRTGQSYELVTADLLDSGGAQHYEYPGDPAGFHLLVNMQGGAVYLLDDRAYRSNLVQLMLLPPSSFASSGPFRLLIDNNPHARVFQLR